MIDTLAQLRAGELAGATRLDIACGLREFPREIFDRADTLEVLNLTGNALSSLPDDLGRLKKLRILFCSDNQFRHLPAVLGDCPNLSMIGFKANQIETIDEAAFPAVLRWLILTDNRLAQLPASLGRCDRLQKLMLSGNRLQELPATMANCTALEMIRLASNEFLSMPEWLLRLPRLTWLAFAGNPCAPVRKVSDKGIAWNELEVDCLIGEGASGVIHRARLPVANRQVAVKVFKGSVTSDGLPTSEIAASLATGKHPHLIAVQARLEGHPSGAEGLVMDLIDPAFLSLAGPPNLATCTRDVYPDGLVLSMTTTMRIASGIAQAGQHLHGQGLMHGDLYAHNVLWKTDGECLLGDLGAAWFYDRMEPEQQVMLQQIEVRAWGCLVEELLSLTNQCSHEDLFMNLQTLAAECLQPHVQARPTFQTVVDRLANLTA